MTRNNLTINFLTGRKIEIPFDPEEPTWKFSQRLGQTENLLTDNGVTTQLKILYENQFVNTYANRLKPIGELIAGNLIAYAVIMTPGKDWLFSGNCSPLGQERDICTICSKGLETINRGSPDNPMIPCALKCSHVFHQGCLKREGHCPSCHETIDPAIRQRIRSI